MRPNILITRDEAQIETAYEKLSKVRILGCDTETSGLHPHKSELYSVQFSDGNFSVLAPLSELTNLGKLGKLLENDAIVKVFHNAKFDLSFLQSNAYEINNVFDTMIAEKALTKGANQSVSLTETLYRYFAVDLDKSQRRKFSKNWNGVWTKELVEYAMNDVIYLPSLMNEQIKWLRNLNLMSIYETELKKIL